MLYRNGIRAVCNYLSILNSEASKNLSEQCILGQITRTTGSEMYTLTCWYGELWLKRLPMVKSQEALVYIDLKARFIREMGIMVYQSLRLSIGYPPPQAC